MSVKKGIIGSDNGLSPVRRQAIIWTNAEILSIRCLGTNNLQWNSNQNTKVFIHENAFENVVYEMAAILSQPQCVDMVSVLGQNDADYITEAVIRCADQWA